MSFFLNFQKSMRPLEHCITCFTDVGHEYQDKQGCSQISLSSHLFLFSSECSYTVSKLYNFVGYLSARRHPSTTYRGVSLSIYTSDTPAAVLHFHNPTHCPLSNLKLWFEVRKMICMVFNTMTRGYWTPSTSQGHLIGAGYCEWFGTICPADKVVCF